MKTRAAVAWKAAQPLTIETVDIRRCASTPSKQSRMIARPTMRPAPAEMPCSARKAGSEPSEPASAQHG